MTSRAHHRQLDFAFVVAACFGALALAASSAAAQSAYMVRGGSSTRTDCFAEFSGGVATYSVRGWEQYRLRCTDGAPCDADGAANDRCAFSVSVCLNRIDPALPRCAPSNVASFAVRQRRRAPDTELSAMQAAVEALGLPTAEPVCSAAVALTVPVRGDHGHKRRGLKRIYTLANSGDGRRDFDRLTLVCDPAASGPAASKTPEHTPSRTPAPTLTPTVAHTATNTPAPTLTPSPADTASATPVDTPTAVPNRPPQVTAAASPAAGEAPLTVHFTATISDPDEDALAVAWAFGDGNTGSGEAVFHTYAAPGSFTATVTVDDGHGGTASAAAAISVADRLAVLHANRYPTRLAVGPGGSLYVTDAKVGSVFVYNADLTLRGELKGLARPLGVAVDASGRIYAGNDGRDNVEVFSPLGVPQFTIDDGNLRMPNDLALDREGRLYVVDSWADTVSVYDATGAWVRNIGRSGAGLGELRFPAAVAVAYRSGDGGEEVGELYVGDQDHARVQVFDLAGNFVGSCGSPVPAFSTDWQGRFVKLQSLAVDGLGRLHAADSYLNKIQILNPGPIRTLGHADTCPYVSSYGSFGTGAGQLNVPLDIAVTASGHVVVANAENHRVEVIYTVAP